ncbi:MAG: AAA family ATPase [Deltaproteobacteria bacterium]|nr:AAA family ATPase [Deltaproteobacteria bacterium]MBW1921934.1 AAA family ATPase [Deltaproteobacteria bacterium]MBW2101171.1 AAA family ATPase [Deltaproteobacteria bacterium]MBW2346302.1 AAA family ATPase [Deltaproteobacteria bacterium]
MYESFYGFKEKPFNLLPDPDYLYMSQGHENAYTHLEYAISENKGFVVITGEIGSGKTTLINFLLRKIQQNILVGIVTHTDVSPAQLIKVICQEYEIAVAGKDKAEMLDAFNAFLLAQFAAGKRVVLIVDEAQNLPAKTLEEIRMLSNLESEKHHLIQIILVGQPELKFKLMRTGMEQFAQRVTVHCHLNGLASEEVANYIRHRLHVAGSGNLEIFTPEAIRAVHEYSRGIPRIINILCDTALVYGFADEAARIDRDLIETVVEERKNAGIFFRAEDETAPVRESVGPAETAPAGWEERLGRMESRVRFLEGLLEGLDQRVTMLSRRRDERDQVVAELFRMLKTSMESRMRLVLRIIQLSGRMKSREPKESSVSEGRRPSLFSRLKKDDT